MGTPTEVHWPGVSGLPHWQALFPQWPPLGLAQARARLRQPNSGRVLRPPLRRHGGQACLMQA